jgi:hypothetical protein
MNSSLLKLDHRRKIILRCILLEIISLNKGLYFLDQICTKYNINTNLQELKTFYENIFDELPVHNSIKEFEVNKEITLYDDNSIEYKTVKNGLKYTIYCQLKNMDGNYEILGLIDFDLTSGITCIVKNLFIDPSFNNKISFHINDISEILIKKTEKISRHEGITYIYINDNFKKISKPLSTEYFYIFLYILIMLKVFRMLLV